MRAVLNTIWSVDVDVQTYVPDSAAVSVSYLADIDAYPTSLATWATLVRRELDEAWVGPGATWSSNGTALISADGLRQYRPPTWKPDWGNSQANFEWKHPDGRFISSFGWQVDLDGFMPEDEAFEVMVE